VIEAGSSARYFEFEQLAYAPSVSQVATRAAGTICRSPSHVLFQAARLSDRPVGGDKIAVLLFLSQRHLNLNGMNFDRTIAEIERLERIFAMADSRPLSASDLAAVNRGHDDKLAYSPWFRLWQRYGVCCRTESNISTKPNIKGTT